MTHEALLSGVWTPVEILEEWDDGEWGRWCVVRTADCKKFAVARRFVRER